METRRRDNSGHSFFELVMVILILGIFAAIATPTFHRSLIHHRIESAARRLKIDLELVRRNAKSRGTNQTIQFDPASSIYILPEGTNLDHPTNAYSVDLRKPPYNVAILSTDLVEPYQVIFDGYGLPDRGAIIRLGIASSYLDVVVDEQSGQIKIQ